MIKKTIKKYLVLICLVTSVLFVFLAALTYPGGSIVDKNSIGFSWSKNFISNLFEIKAVNGSQNPARIWARIGMAFHAIGYGVFFINITKKISSKLWKYFKIYRLYQYNFYFLDCNTLTRYWGNIDCANIVWLIYDYSIYPTVKTSFT